MIQQDGTSAIGDIGGDELEGNFREQDLPSCISPLSKRSQSSLAINSSTGLLERWAHIGGDGFYTIVGESWKYDSEAQSEWGQQKRCRYDIRDDRALFCTYI